MEQIPEEMYEESREDEVVTRLMMKDILASLSEEEKELLLLRYVNEVPVTAICQILQISRFALYRKLKKALQKLKMELGEGGAL